MAPVAKKNKNKSNTVQPTILKNDADKEQLTPSVVSGQLAKKLSKRGSQTMKQRGVVFIKHLPHGFFEEQMKNYFEQFGQVTRLRLARSRRTGNTKGFAFVEFEYPEVAQIAAETMNNYLMFHRIVKAAYIPPEEQKFNYFKTTVRKVTNKAGKEIYVSGKTAAIQREVKKHNDWSDKSYQKRTERTMKKLEKLQKKYEHLGIDFTKIMVSPIKLQPNDMKAKKEVEEQTKLDTAPGSLLLIRKRKLPQNDSKSDGGKKITLKSLLEDTLGDEDSSEDEDYVASECSDESESVLSIENNTKTDLKDLLENTLVDDDSSDDEDFVVSECSDQADDKSSDDEDNDAMESCVDDDEDSENEARHIAPAKVNSKCKGMRKSAGCLDELIKRKPYSGGIQKYNQKSLKSTPISKAKKDLQKAAAKELIKTTKEKWHLLGKAVLKNKNKQQKV